MVKKKILILCVFLYGCAETSNKPQVVQPVVVKKEEVSEIRKDFEKFLNDAKSILKEGKLDE